jgi:hypothetical protein
MALRVWQTGWQGNLGRKQLSSREFAVNPIGVFFDPDAESGLPFDFPRYCLLSADIRGRGLPTFALFA